MAARLFEFTLWLAPAGHDLLTNGNSPRIDAIARARSPAQPIAFPGGSASRWICETWAKHRSNGGHECSSGAAASNVGKKLVIALQDR
jgi:hypothetical protein